MILRFRMNSAVASGRLNNHLTHAFSRIAQFIESVHARFRTGICLGVVTVIYIIEDNFLSLVGVRIRRLWSQVAGSGVYSRRRAEHPFLDFDLPSAAKQSFLFKSSRSTNPQTLVADLVGVRIRRLWSQVAGSGVY